MERLGRPQKEGGAVLCGADECPRLIWQGRVDPANLRDLNECERASRKQQQQLVPPATSRTQVHLQPACQALGNDPEGLTRDEPAIEVLSATWASPLTPPNPIVEITCLVATLSIS